VLYDQQRRAEHRRKLQTDRLRRRRQCLQCLLLAARWLFCTNSYMTERRRTKCCKLLTLLSSRAELLSVRFYNCIQSTAIFSYNRLKRVTNCDLFLAQLQRVLRYLAFSTLSQFSTWLIQPIADGCLEFLELCDLSLVEARKILKAKKTLTPWTKQRNKDTDNYPASPQHGNETTKNDRRYSGKKCQWCRPTFKATHPL